MVSVDSYSHKDSSPPWWRDPTLYINEFNKKIVRVVVGGGVAEVLKMPTQTTQNFEKFQFGVLQHFENLRPKIPKIILKMFLTNISLKISPDSSTIFSKFPGTSMYYFKNFLQL